MTQPDWDDDRLDAAFHARFDRSAPPALAKDIHVRIAGTSPTRFRVPRVGQPWSLAAAAVVVVLIGAAMFVPASLSLPGASPAPTGGSPSEPAATATPTEQALPGSLFDGALPIVGVREAIALRDSGADDSEIAVHGWFTPAPPFDCGEPSPDAVVDPLQLRCPDDIVWLAEDAESLVRASNGGYESVRPNGLWLNPDLDGLDTSWYPALPALGVDGGSTPADVVLVGHFDDRRAELCPRSEIDACRDRFVVDSVAVVHGVAQPLSETHETPDAVSSDHEIAAVVANETPDAPILSATVVDGPTGLAVVEPSLGTGQAGLIDQPVLWVVRVLESGHLATYIVVDGSDAIYEMNPNNDPILVGGTPPSSAATDSPGPWPPAGATVVEVVNRVGIDGSTAQVAVVDKSGRLVSVVVPNEMAIQTGVDDFGAYGEPGKPGRVNLGWIGGACDSEVTVTVAADLKSISFDMGPRPACDSIGVGHELILDFSGTVDVPAIVVGEGIAAPSTAPSGVIPHKLDCGPLGPDACHTKALDLIAATPGKHLVSLMFHDECGSYEATYDNGDDISATVDCIPGASPS